MEFDPHQTYRMPVAFGPMPGPRQHLDGRAAHGDTARIESFTLAYLTEERPLAALLPPGFALAGAPVVSVEFTTVSEVPWLAGRGYNTLAFRWPVRFEGERDRATGSFVAVVWENKADPILTGREELGYAKLFCDLDVRQEPDGARRCRASWEGHTFVDLAFTDLVPVDPTPVLQQDGLLHYRYMPGVGAGAGPVAAGAVVTPPVDGIEVSAQATATGRVDIRPSTWEQLPTLYHIVNRLHALPVVAYREAVMRVMRKDISNRRQRCLA